MKSLNLKFLEGAVSEVVIISLFTQPISFPQRDCTAVWLLTSR